jgi:TonB family protein
MKFIVQLACLIFVPISFIFGDQPSRDVSVQHFESPLYDPVAQRARRQGDAVLKVQIAPDGSVRDAQGIQGDPLLVRNATNNIRTWKFNQGDERTFNITYEYRLLPPEIECGAETTVTFDLPSRLRVASRLLKIGEYQDTLRPPKK